MVYRLLSRRLLDVMRFAEELALLQLGEVPDLADRPQLVDGKLFQGRIDMIDLQALRDAADRAAPAQALDSVFLTTVVPVDLVLTLVLVVRDPAPGHVIMIARIYIRLS